MKSIRQFFSRIAQPATSALRVQDAAVETNTNNSYNELVYIANINKAGFAAITQAVSAIGTSLQKLTTAPSQGMFNPPTDLVKRVSMEVMMSVMQLEVGQTAVGMLKFDEITPPADGAVSSDNAAVCPISLAADKVTWTAGPALAVGMANFMYTGTSAAPDVGPAVVAPLVTTVIAVPVAEHGDFDPTTAVITGP